MSDAAPAASRGIPARPLPPVLLGVAGLIPFWALAVAHVVGLPREVPPPALAFALAAYAATIASFLGGIRWGMVAREENQAGVAADYVLGVLPQLVGWGALALPDPWRFAVLGLLILVLGPLDRRLVSRGLAPEWFGRLRMLLSLGAGAALFLAALA